MEEQKPQIDFEQAVARLESIAQQLEQGRLPLAESLAAYEEGVQLLRRCYELLQSAERKIEMLAGMDAEGRPITQPFEAGASFSPEEPKLPKARRRKTSDLE